MSHDAGARDSRNEINGTEIGGAELATRNSDSARIVSRSVFLCRFQRRFVISVECKFIYERNWVEQLVKCSDNHSVTI